MRAITSEYPDEERKKLILEMGKSEKRVLVATDCLSEGINLQELFTAVLHYDLPWNPNRLEQREGRVDRFGQTSPEVRTALVYGEDNPIDSVVLRVLLRKVRAIRDTLGISIPFPEDSRPLMDAIFNEVLLESNRIIREAKSVTPEFPWDTSELLKRKEEEVEASLEKAKKKAEVIRSIFAHEGIKADELESDLKAADEAAGSPEDVERFTLDAVRSLYGGVAGTMGKGWKLDPSNLPEELRNALGDDIERDGSLPIAFRSPVPEGFKYVGRIHRFVSAMCEDLLSRSLDPTSKARMSRAAVVETKGVEKRTVILLVRARNLIRERREKRQIVAGELLLWGWRGGAQAKDFIDPGEAERLMREALPSANLSIQDMQYWFGEVMAELPELRSELDTLAFDRAVILAKQHERYRDLTKGRDYRREGRFEAVEPALSPDIVGIYVFIPGDRS